MSSPTSRTARAVVSRTRRCGSTDTRTTYGRLGTMRPTAWPSIAAAYRASSTGSSKQFGEPLAHPVRPTAQS
ncbi:hypothetical protein [Streptomyces afghaniensis]|uniref:hypothetical protein n=1 Tax=Streptomyces afghaniensis TaxID=66865 RepID=UPI0037A482CE